MIPFQLKGSAFTLPILKVLSSEWADFTTYLEKILVMSPRFFTSAPLVVDITAIEHDQEIDLFKLLEILRTHQLVPVALRTDKESMRILAKELFLAIFSPESQLKKDLESKKPEVQEQEEYSSSPDSTHILKAEELTGHHNPTLIIHHPVRSGQQVYAQGGDLIILAPVSPGAEILADGHIHVYGPLRGRVFAGMNGNTKSRIFCHSLNAEFISIAGRYLLCEHLDYARVQNATQIFLEDDQLKIAPL